MEQKVNEIILNISTEKINSEIIVNKINQIAPELINLAKTTGNNLFKKTFDKFSTNDKIKIKSFLVREKRKILDFDLIFSFLDQFKIAGEKKDSKDTSRYPSAPVPRGDISQKEKEENLTEQGEFSDFSSSPSTIDLPDLPNVPDLPGLREKPATAKKKDPPTSSAAIRSRMLKGLNQIKDTVPNQEEKPPIIEESDSLVGTELSSLSLEKNDHGTKSIPHIEIKTEERQTHKRNVLIDYFNRMILNKTYEFKVRISKQLVEAGKMSKNIVSGERRTQLKEEIVVTDLKPIEIELNMPGCLVTPNIHYISPNVNSAVISFFITPVAMFKNLDARLKIGQGKLNKKVILLPVSVINNRILKLLSAIGVLIAFLPSLWPVLFQVDFNQQLVIVLQSFLPSLSNPLLVALELGLGGIFIVIAFVIWKLYGEKKAEFELSREI